MKEFLITLELLSLLISIAKYREFKSNINTNQIRINKEVQSDIHAYKT